MLAGKPKCGKTFLALNLAIAVATGGRALGKVEVERGDVLMLALEGTLKNLQHRIRTAMNGDPPPRNLYLCKEWPAGKDAIAKLSDLLRQHPGTRLVIVDTLKAIREPTRGLRNAYEVDYETVAPFSRLAEEKRTSILLLHHNNKMQQLDDPYDAISGTTGLRGGVDTQAVLLQGQTNQLARLLAQGRELEPIDLSLAFDTRLLTWRLSGETAEVVLNEARRQMLNVLKEIYPEDLSPSEVYEILVDGGYNKTESNVRHLLSKMAKDTETPVSSDNGRYKYAPSLTHSHHSQHSLNGSPMCYHLLSERSEHGEGVGSRH